jgi:hypothetical protein
MQVAKLTQDYYGFLSKSILPNKQAGLGRAPRPAVLPAERLVEGELLRKNKGAGNALSDMLQRGRFSGAAGSQSQDQANNLQSAQRAISAYLGYSASWAADNAGQPHAVDYYA